MKFVSVKSAENSFPIDIDWKNCTIKLEDDSNYNVDEICDKKNHLLPKLEPFIFELTS